MCCARTVSCGCGSLRCKGGSRDGGRCGGLDNVRGCGRAGGEPSRARTAGGHAAVGVDAREHGGGDLAQLLALTVIERVEHEVDDRDRDQEARAGRYWIDIGRGAWDSQGRPSEARVNRIIRIDPDTVRRIGAILEEEIFRDVAREVLRHY